MMRKTMKLLVVALAAVLTFGSMAEAAPKKAVHKRVKHSTRVSAASGATTTKKKTTSHSSDGAKTTKKTTVTKKSHSPSTKPH